VRVHSASRSPQEGMASRVLRLDGLPLRPATVRAMSGLLGEEAESAGPELRDSARGRTVWELDPGWVLAGPARGRQANPLELVANSRWWPSSLASEPVGEILDRLWRHSVFISLAARSLAREAGEADPEALARAGLVCRLGCWAMAAVEPEWLVRWWNEFDSNARRRREFAELGMTLTELGRRIAENWGCDPLVGEAAWLHRDRSLPLAEVITEHKKLGLVQEAYRWAEQTPWSIDSPAREGMPSDPRLRILIAEVQSRTGGTFGAADATAYEERMTQQNAKLRLRLAASAAVRSRSERILQAIAESKPDETLAEWGERAAKSWCAEPGITAARIVWADPAGRISRDQSETIQPTADAASPAPGDRRPPTLVLPLSIHGRIKAQLELWCDPSRREFEAENQLVDSPEWAAWQNWATNLSDRALLERRMQSLLGALRNVVETEDTRLKQEKLAALAEFAAGAGHEINNPLAVVVGRAQLLLTRSQEPESTRSLQIILDQALRAHRILRDLIFVARPPILRRRKCRPSEILQMCLRGLQGECETRGIRLINEVGDADTSMIADPEALNHLAQIVLRNAIQATPSGGKIEVRSSVHNGELVWSFSDSGKGITPTEGAHLFDPFFSGRQAGRGLGLGLPRAARFLEMAGGHVRWTSSPGHGSAFHVHLPLSGASQEGEVNEPSGPVPARNGGRAPIA
jgi:signal transduction histidine kinase